MTARQQTPTPVALGKIIQAVLAVEPAADAVSFEGRWRTYAELADTVSAIEALLAAETSGPGTRIGVLLRNRPPQLAALLAVLASDHCLVTLNPNYPDATLAQDIAGLNLPVLIGGADDLGREGVIAACGGASVIELPVDLGAAPVLQVKRVRPAPAGDPALIEMLTSGTTGKPKRIALQRDRFEQAFAKAVLEETGDPGAPARLRPGCRVLVAPVTHIGGIWGSLRWIVSGRRLVLLERFSLEPWCQAVEDNKPVSAALPPAALKMILDAKVPAPRLASLQVLTAGTAPTAPEIVDQFWERYQIAVLTNYGATEFAGPVAGWSLNDFKTTWQAKRGSVGRLYPGVSARIVDPESGAEAPMGAIGVLQLRGPQFPEPDAWLETTDLAILDEDDFLYVVGRSDAAIIRGGFKVHPDEVRRVIEDHPDIREAVVVGIPDARLGAVPAAAIMLRSGAVYDAEGLMSYLRERLLAYQIPAVIRPVDDVPRTMAMKPALAEVRTLLSAAHNAA